MANRIFLDTNCIVDLLLKRDPNYKYVRQIVEENQGNLYISILTITNAQYIARIKDQVSYKNFLEIFNIIDFTKILLEKSFRLGINDIEDDVQFVSALQENCEYLITSDVQFKKYPKLVEVMSPRAFSKIAT